MLIGIRKTNIPETFAGDEFSRFKVFGSSLFSHRGRLEPVELSLIELSIHDFTDFNSHIDWFFGRSNIDDGVIWIQDYPVF